MDHAQIELVRASFTRAARIAPHLAATFYAELFAVEPELRAMFRSDMVAQGAKLMATLQFVVDHLDNHAALLPAVRALGVKHLDYAVESRHYEAVGTALLRTLRHEIGPDFTPEVRAAWTAAYAMLAGEMRAAAYPQVA